MQYLHGTRAYLKQLIMQTEHILFLQLDSTGTDYMLKEGFLQGNPNLIPNSLARQYRYTSVPMVDEYFIHSVHSSGETSCKNLCRRGCMLEKIVRNIFVVEPTEGRVGGGILNILSVRFLFEQNCKFFPGNIFYRKFLSTKTLIHPKNLKKRSFRMLVGNFYVTQNFFFHPNRIEIGELRK